MEMNDKNRFQLFFEANLLKVKFANSFFLQFAFSVRVKIFATFDIKFLFLHIRLNHKEKNM